MTTDPIHPHDGPDQSALRDDLRDLSTTDLESLVAKMCSAYGTVMKVVVHASHAHLNGIRAFALVDMSELEEAERLATAFGRRSVGTAVLLLLQPRAASSA